MFHVKREGVTRNQGPGTKVPDIYKAIGNRQ